LPVNFNREVHGLLGLPFDRVDMAAAVARVRAAAGGGTPCFLSTPNLNFLIGCRGDSAFRDSVMNSDLCIADGMPLVWMARLLGIPLRERVAGSSLFEVLRGDAARPMSVYFFGGPPGIAARACEKLNAEGGGLHCAGFASPGFGSIEAMSRDEMIASINESGAGFLVVALGAKKGQAWIVRNRDRITVPVISHLGAVVNFVAGTIDRAPRWMQVSGLEWLWRIKEEPGLWRRYWMDGCALLQLLFTRVLPCAAHQRLNRPGAQDLARASVVHSDHGANAIIQLAGAWTRENLDPLRRCFSAVVRSPGGIRIDFTAVSHADSACIGLLMLLYGYQRSRGAGFSVRGISPQLRRIFELSCAEYMLER